MRIIKPLSLLILLLTSCGGSEKPNDKEDGKTKPSLSSGPVKVTGKLAHSKDSIKKAYFKPFYQYFQYKVHLDSAGRFEEKFSLPRPLYLTFLRKKIFLRPGDSLHIEGDIKNGAKSLSFSGDAAKENEYLLNRSEVTTRLYGRSPETFIKGLDSVQRLYKELLDSHELSRKFVRREKQRMKWEKAVQRLRYENIHHHFTENKEDSLDLPDDFYAPLKELEPEPRLDISIPDFYNFLRFYAHHMAQQKQERDSTAKGKPMITLRKQAIDERFGNDTVSTALLAKSLFTKLQREGIEHTKPLLEELEESSLFPDLTDSLRTRYEAWKPIAKGKEAPGFAYPNREGDTVSLKDLRGNYVYIDAWATWCGPCKREIPHLKELEEQFADENVSFVSISLDEKDDRAKWKKMVKKKELEGHQLIANGEAFGSKLANDYLINSIPRFILISPDGKIIDNNAERPSGDAAEQLKEVLKDKAG